MTSKTIIVTGSSGYIGGQTAIQLKDLGHRVIGIDHRIFPGHLRPVCDYTYQEDFALDYGLSLLEKHEPDAIVHCAGTSLVGPSMTHPQEYYYNNYVKTKRLCDAILKLKKRPRLIFSSSAATYGNPVMTPCQEIDPVEPISPYGESKLMIEWMLRSYAHAYGLDYVAFRYFNACGADSQARHGQADNATHIIARVLESLRDRREFTLYGTDYDTDDGTCIRDYVHVEDIARAHIQAIDSTIPAGVYNLGTAHGASNKEIIDIAESVTGLTVNMITGARREGDPAILTADSSKFQKVSGWTAQYSLDDVIKHAWAWYTR